mmetsp:Transcript_21158/g.42394  ORF Transcript_21158/g.42394 Transcript_21158/m.42394 type:complete len:230 (-) Transcript_21158:986-1675(-)
MLLVCIFFKYAFKNGNSKSYFLHVSYYNQKSIFALSVHLDFIRRARRWLPPRPIFPEMSQMLTRECFQTGTEHTSRSAGPECGGSAISHCVPGTIVSASSAPRRRWGRGGHRSVGHARLAHLPRPARGGREGRGGGQWVPVGGRPTVSARCVRPPPRFVVGVRQRARDRARRRDSGWRRAGVLVRAAAAVLPQDDHAGAGARRAALYQGDHPEPAHIGGRPGHARGGHG